MVCVPGKPWVSGAESVDVQQLIKQDDAPSER